MNNSLKLGAKVENKNVAWANINGNLKQGAKG
jgi:hypothetical protein